MNRVRPESGWRLPYEQLSAIVQGHGIEVGHSSPLYEMESATAPETTQDQQLLSAVRSVAKPAFEFGVFLSPPHGDDILWFYKGQDATNGELTGHLRVADRGHSFVSLNERDLQNLISQCLDLQHPTSQSVFSETLSTNAFVALLAVIDATREHKLLAMIQRKACDELSFALTQISGMAARSVLTTDMRWLGSLANALSPAAFRIDDDSLIDGLQELVSSMLITHESNRWQLHPNAATFAADLGVPLSWAAVRSKSADTERTQHLAFVRGMGGLWQLSFFDSEVKIDCVSNVGIEFAIDNFFFECRPTVSDHLPNEPALIVCDHCRQSVRHAKFCSNCGKPLSSIR